MKAVTRSIPKQPTPQIEKIVRFKGLNVGVDSTQLEYNESPDMLNMVLDTEGALEKRTGYQKVITILPGIFGLFEYHKEDGTTEYLAHSGTKFYRFELDGSSSTQIYSGLAMAKTSFFQFAGKCYILDGAHYLEYDGTTVQEPEPYVPTLFISSPPSGGGTAYEDFNLLGTKFKQSFSGDGTATAFQLALSDIDNVPLVVTVDGVSKTDGIDFTVNLVTGTVNFTTAPSNGTNNVIIQAEKTVSGMKDKITKCTSFKIYGGTNDTRIFLWGSDNNTLYRSDVYKANYFPENAFQKVGSEDSSIMAMTQQYDTAIIHKEDSLWAMSYSQDNEGNVIFPVKPINSFVGTVANHSVQLIENDPVMLSKKGVYRLTGGTVRDERNVQPISKRVDKLLLAEISLENAISIDFDNKYMLFLNEHVYIYDYHLDEWYRWDNMNASCVIEIEGYLYFGDFDGNIYKLLKKTDSSPYSDDGVVINAYWTSRALDFGTGSRYKTIKRTFVTLKPSTQSGAKIYYIDSSNEKTLIDTINISTFSYTNYNYPKFSYLLSDYPRVSPARPKIKKVSHFQFRIENNALNESLGVLSVEMEYEVMGYIKG